MIVWNLILIIGILFVIALWSVAITQIVIAKKHSNSDDKTDQQQSKDEPTKEVNPSDNTAGTTDVPTVGNVVIPLQQGDMVTVTTCSNGSNKNNDQICTATKEPETVVQQQSTPTPQVTQLKQSGNLESSNNYTSNTTRQQ